MLQRCYNPNSTNYRNYGGRGIGVCERWRFGENGQHPIVCYVGDKGNPPLGKSLDRIDVNGDYEPDNCRWASASEQRRNQRPLKRKGRRADVAQIQAFAAALTRAASAPGEVGRAP
jgi:hypothetical protein